MPQRVLSISSYTQVTQGATYDLNSVDSYEFRYTVVSSIMLHLPGDVRQITVLNLGNNRYPFYCIILDGIEVRDRST